MKIPGLCLLLFSIAVTANSQTLDTYAQTDRMAMYIKDAQAQSTADIASFINANFDSEKQKVRAAYVWVITHIRYSTDSVHRVILNEDRDQLISLTMRRRKGVCENFSAVFNDICRKLYLRTYVIGGYTKQGNTVDKTTHAWCAVFVNKEWALYDPTWDAVQAGNTVIPVPTNYYQVAPAEFIETHMPFDPMFQLLDYPLTYKEFNTGYRKPIAEKVYFNFNDSIRNYETYDPFSAYSSTLSRIENNGPHNAMVDSKISQLKMELEIINQDKDSINYNSAIENYNTAISLYNSFITYRNNQFRPAKSNAEVDTIFNNIQQNIALARTKLKRVDQSKATLILNTGDIYFALEKLEKNVRNQQLFFKENNTATKK